MIRKIGLIVAASAMLVVIFVGASTFACGGQGNGQYKGIQSARAPMTGSCCPGGKAAASCAGMSAADCAKMAATGCKGMKGASASGCGMMGSTAGSSGCAAKSEAKTASAGMSTCGAKASAGRSCCPGGKSAAAKTSFDANVYQVKDGSRFAVAEGKTFEVTGETPYYEAGLARYYFPDKGCLTSCSDKMSKMIPAIDREAVALVKMDGNVTVDKYGKRYAICPMHRQKFLVTADSPARVMDGARYYACSEDCWQKIMTPATHAEGDAAK